MNPDLIQGATGDIYLLKLSDDSVKKIVDQPGPDNGPRFSPDGKQIVFLSVMGDKLYFASNSRLAIVGVEGGTPKSITDSFDENPGLLEWKRDGIYFGGLQKTASHLFRVDPVERKIHARLGARWSHGRCVFPHPKRRSDRLHRCFTGEHERTVCLRDA